MRHAERYAKTHMHAYDFQPQRPPFVLHRQFSHGESNKKHQYKQGKQH